MPIAYKKSSNGIVINVKVEPRSSKAVVSGLLGDQLKVKLTSAPIDGAANKQLIEVLAKFFGVKKKAVRIIKGHTSKTKVVEIEGLQKPPDI